MSRPLRYRAGGLGEAARSRGDICSQISGWWSLGESGRAPVCRCQEASGELVLSGLRWGDL